ncbi:MAG: glycosyltransferase family 4 protein [Chitinispirillaceae bacterium]|nr:glycosyltransferase family 4 protein [Chitinispirillaceae bacterium]
MNIAIDCRPLQNRYADRGVGTVVRNLLSCLVKSRYSSSIILCGSAPSPPLRCGRYVILRRPQTHDWLHEQLRWPFDLRSMKADIFHATVSLGLLREIGFPLVCGAKSIATVYDLNPLHLSALKSHTKMKSFWIQRVAVRRADRVITISRFVKDDLVARLHIKENKIRVLPLAVDEAVARAYDACFPLSHAPAEPYLLTLGETENKNIGAAVAVFERLCEDGFAGTLRVIGALEKQTDAVKRSCRASRYRDRIIFTGSVTTDQLVSNYALCTLFLIPSRLEGFGLPVLEAMYCGAPVIASNSTSLPEAGGDAALYCHPGDTAGMADAARRLLQNDALRSELSQKGKAHARRRTWNDAAALVLDLYDELSGRT